MRHSLGIWQGNASPLFGFQNDFDRLFDGIVSRNRSSKDPDSQATETFVPSCEVVEAGNHYLVSLEVAGVAKKDIHLEIHNNELVISGERRSPRSERKLSGSDAAAVETESAENSTSQSVRQAHQDCSIYSEMRFGKFERRFKIPVGIEISRVEASYQDGILRVQIPKVESARPQQIQITDGLSRNSLN